MLLLQCEVYADIGEVITGEKEALWQQTTVFKSVGMSDRYFRYVTGLL